MQYNVRFLPGCPAIPAGLEDKIRKTIETQGVDSIWEVSFFFIFDDSGKEWLCLPIGEDNEVTVEDIYVPG